MKTISVQVPDDFQIPENYEVKIVKRIPKFKKGDVIINGAGTIAIYEKTLYENDEAIVYYHTLYSNRRGVCKVNKVDCGIRYENECKRAISKRVC